MKVLYSKKNGISNKLSGVNLPVDANKINYDNTESELQSTNVQDAIDEVVATLDNKVDKVIGKGLSTNDYDNTDKAKVDKIDETTTSATGNPISISGLKSNQLAKNPIITFEPIQAGSGDPSPSNVRAISGYDKIEILSLRKNLFTDSSAVITTDHSTFILRDYKVNLVAGTYTFSFDFSGSISNAQMVLYNGSDIDGSIVDVYDTGAFDIIAGRNSISFTINENAMNVKFYSNATGTYSNFQLELGNTATAFEPYNPITNIQLTLGQTIYGGTLDVEKGILTVDRGYADLGTLEWTYSSNNRFTSTLTDAKSTLGSEIANAICSKYPIVTRLVVDSTIGISLDTYDNIDYVNIRDTDYSDVATFKTAMNGVQLAYELATPYTIQLTPHEISLLKDYTYVSTNGTNMSFSYKNGEVASLGDVENLGKTVNLLGTETDLQIGNLSSRTPNNISSRLNNLITAVSEQNLEKYGYKIGDYFNGTSQASNNFRYWLADMDTFYGGYDYYAVESVHHIGIVVDTNTNSQWYTGSDITDVGYDQSTLHSYLSGSALNIIKADMIALFGGSTGLEHLLGHTKLWNKLGAWYWSDKNTHSQYIAALTECQLAGAKIWSADNYQQGEGHKQLNLFVKYCFNQIFGWTWIWLRSIASSGRAVRADRNGDVFENGVSSGGRAAGLILFH